MIHRLPTLLGRLLRSGATCLDTVAWGHATWEALGNKPVPRGTKKLACAKKLRRFFTAPIRFYSAAARVMSCLVSCCVVSFLAGGG